jgi:hypothetical protein
MDFEARLNSFLPTEREELNSFEKKKQMLDNMINDAEDTVPVYIPKEYMRELNIIIRIGINNHPHLSKKILLILIAGGKPNGNL